MEECWNRLLSIPWAYPCSSKAMQSKVQPAPSSLHNNQSRCPPLSPPDLGPYGIVYNKNSTKYEPHERVSTSQSNQQKGLKRNKEVDQLGGKEEELFTWKLFILASTAHASLYLNSHNFPSSIYIVEPANQYTWKLPTLKPPKKIAKSKLLKQTPTLKRYCTGQGGEGESLSWHKSLSHVSILRATAGEAETGIW